MAVARTGIASLALVAMMLWRAVSLPPATLAGTPAAAEAPVPAITPPATATLESVAVDVDALIDAYGETTGLVALLGRWGVTYDRTAGPACAQAEQAGLLCYFQRGTWSTLRQLDRPAVLTLTASNGTNREVALIGLDAETAVIATDGEPVSLPVIVLSDYWFGQFMILWRPAIGIDEAIGPGMRGENVRWLRQSLATINGLELPAGPNQDLFDTDLERQVTEFQRKHRLESDGLAGQKTQIIINTLLALEDRPRLSVN